MSQESCGELWEVKIPALSLRRTERQGRGALNVNSRGKSWASPRIVSSLTGLGSVSRGLTHDFRPGLSYAAPTGLEHSAH
jgi:hypothetical protein